MTLFHLHPTLKLYGHSRAFNKFLSSRLYWKSRRLGRRAPNARASRAVSTKHLLRTADYGLGTKHGLGYKTRTKHYGLGVKYTCAVTQDGRHWR